MSDTQVIIKGICCFFGSVFYLIYLVMLFACNIGPCGWRVTGDIVFFFGALPGVVFLILTFFASPLALILAFCFFYGAVTHSPASPVWASRSSIAIAEFARTDPEAKIARMDDPFYSDPKYDRSGNDFNIASSLKDGLEVSWKGYGRSREEFEKSYEGFERWFTRHQYPKDGRPPMPKYYPHYFAGGMEDYGTGSDNPKSITLMPDGTLMISFDHGRIIEHRDRDGKMLD